MLECNNTSPLAGVTTKTLNSVPAGKKEIAFLTDSLSDKT